MGILMVLRQPRQQETLLFNLQTRVLERGHPEKSPKEQFPGEQTTLRTHRGARITLAISVTT